MTNIIQRIDYMKGNVSCKDYYGQFVSDWTVAYVVSHIGEEALLNSNNPHLNDIPLAKWDKLTARMPVAIRFADAGEIPSLGVLVCIAKTAARRYIEEAKAEA